MHVFSKYINKVGNLDSNKIKLALQDPDIIALHDKLNWCKSIGELFYCFKHQIHSEPKCNNKDCQSTLIYRNPKYGYGVACSKECISKCISVKNKKSKKTSTRYRDLRNQYKEKYHWIKTYQEGLYCQKNNILSRPKCYCGNYTKFVGGKYSKRCSTSCANKQDAEKKLINASKTNLKKYGVKNYSRSKEFSDRQEEIQQKIIETSYKKYGARTYNQRHTKEIEKTYSREYLIEEYINKQRPIYDIADEHQTSQYYLGQRIPKLTKIFKIHLEWHIYK